MWEINRILFLHIDLRCSIAPMLSALYPFSSSCGMGKFVCGFIVAISYKKKENEINKIFLLGTDLMKEPLSPLNSLYIRDLEPKIELQKKA